MPHWSRLALILAAPAAAVLVAAAEPSAFATLSPGEWEFTKVPGTNAPLRQCVSDIASLAQFEHRGRSCSRTVLSDSGASTVVDYSCGSAGFGRSQIDVITPRSIRISTQGISQSLPFNYVLQARRVGDCGKNANLSRH